MFTSIVIGALSAAGMIQQTDTIIDAGDASRLALESFRGEVVVRTWDRHAVQVNADHPSSRFIEIDKGGNTIHVEVGRDRGMGFSGTVDFEISVPRSMDISIEGMALDVDIDGAGGEVDVHTIHGNITLSGGRGSVSLETVNGSIEVEGADGDIDVTGVAGEVTITDSSGDIYVEAAAGSITLQGVTSRDIEAGTVGGSLRFEGSILDGGQYTFGTHAGQIHECSCRRHDLGRGHRGGFPRCTHRGHPRAWSAGPEGEGAHLRSRYRLGPHRCGDFCRDGSHSPGRVPAVGAPRTRGGLKVRGSPEPTTHRIERPVSSRRWRAARYSALSGSRHACLKVLSESGTFRGRVQERPPPSSSRSEKVLCVLYGEVEPCT